MSPWKRQNKTKLKHCSGNLYQLKLGFKSAAQMVIKNMILPFHEYKENIHILHRKNRNQKMQKQAEQFPLKSRHWSLIPKLNESNSICNIYSYIDICPSANTICEPKNKNKAKVGTFRTLSLMLPYTSPKENAEARATCQFGKPQILN